LDQELFGPTLSGWGKPGRGWHLPDQPASPGSWRTHSKWGPRTDNVPPTHQDPLAHALPGPRTAWPGPWGAAGRWVSSQPRGRKKPGKEAAEELEEAVEKLLLPRLLPQLLSPEQQAETALAGSSARCRGRIRTEEGPRVQRSQSRGHGERPGCDRGRGGRGGVAGKFGLFPAAGWLRGTFAAEMDPRLGIAPVPGCFRTTGLGKARLNRGQVAWRSPGQPAWKGLGGCAGSLLPGWNVYPAARGRSGGGQPWSEASCLSCPK